MQEEEGNGETTPPLEPRRHELLVADVGEDNTPAAAVSTHMNFEGSRFQPLPAPSDGGARSLAGCRSGGHQVVHAQSIMGLSLVSVSGEAALSAVNKVGAGAARGGQNAELQSKGRHSDNAFHNTRAQTFGLIHIHTYIEHTHFP